MKAQKPMELKFSELTPDEKAKYIQFLVSNNIVFEEEKENNNFVATIKFMQKGGEKAIQKEKAKPVEKVEIKKAEKNGQYSDAFAVAGSFSGLNALKKGKERKELKEIQNTYVENKDDIWIRAGKELVQNKRSRSSNQNERDNNHEKNEKDEIKTECDSKIPKSIQNLRKYSRFFGIFKFLDANTHAKRFPKEWALRLIEEIYSFKFVKDTKSIKTTKNVNNSKENNLNEDFPAVVFMFFIDKFKNLKFAEQNAINFAATIDFYEKDCLDITLFSKYFHKIDLNDQFLSFLAEIFDKNDLIFFLFVRSILEKELSIQIFSALKKEYVDLNTVDISMKQCFAIVTNVFGPQEKDLINKFSIMIKSYFSNQKSNAKSKMKAYQFLYLLLQEYHQNKLETQNKMQKPFDFRENPMAYHNIVKNNETVPSTSKNLKPEFDMVFNEVSARNDPMKSTEGSHTNSEATKDENNSEENEFIEFNEPHREIEKESASSASSQTSKQRIYSDLEKKILFGMEENISEFINLLIDESSDLSEPKHIVKSKLNKIVLRKVYKMCESLFDYDKLSWYRFLSFFSRKIRRFILLRIENPGQVQLNNVENLQKELRKIQKTNLMEKKEIDKLCKNILQTPELIKEISRLAIAFMI